MPLETATYISDLVTANPASSDPLSNADDHMRLIKAAAKATLAHTGALTNSSNQLIPAAGTATAPTYSFAVEPTLGIYRSAAGILTMTGGKLKGIRDPGELAMFPKEPASLGKATTDTGKDWLELNGATYNRADYPALADFFNGVGVGTTFTVPNAYDTGRFLRSRTASVAALTAQANTTGPHVHPNAVATTDGENQEHTHVAAGTTAGDSPDHTHPFSVTGTLIGPGVLVAGGGSFFGPNTTNGNTGGASVRHTHSFAVTTSGRSAQHNHTVTTSTPANTGTTETRPEALTVVFVIKT